MNNEKKDFGVIIYHDHCNDGLTAAAIAANLNQNAILVPASYGTELDVEPFRNEDIVFVDFSTKLDIMLGILDVAKSVTVIDHHVTAEQELAKIDNLKFNFVYDINLSGAQLAWDYFIGTKQPMFVKLIGDRDLWTKKYQDSDAMSLALRVLKWDYVLMRLHINHLILNEVRYLDAVTSDLIEKGRQFSIYHQYMVSQISEHAYTYRLDDDSDTEVLRVNCPMGLMSDVGANLAKHSPSGVVWLTYETEEFTKHSLRVSAESDYDAAAFAATMGGGGHKKAAGWQVSHYRSTTLNEELEKANVINGSTSDGYHTFDELYDHRMTLFSIICNQNKEQAWKSLLHDDGTMFDDYFIVGIKTPEGQYTYHYHMDVWEKFDVTELERAPEWDGHIASDIERLYSLLKPVAPVIPKNPLA